MFTFPTSRAPAAAPSSAPAPTPASVTTPVSVTTPAPTDFAPTTFADDEPLELTDEAGDDELLLDSDDILTSPVASAPIAAPADDGEAKRESGTLFERMSNIARGAPKANIDEDDGPGLRREPIDIPRFLNRQNNQ